MRLLEDEGVFASPGCDYDQKQGTNHIRYDSGLIPMYQKYTPRFHCIFFSVQVFYYGCWTRYGGLTETHDSFSNALYDRFFLICCLFHRISKMTYHWNDETEWKERSCHYYENIYCPNVSASSLSNNLRRMNIVLLNNNFSWRGRVYKQ